VPSSVSDWCARLGSNQQPLPSEGSTLSIELRALQRESATKSALKRDREDTRFPATRPPTALERPRQHLRQPPTASADPGKRPLKTLSRRSPPPKLCVYNRPWLNKEKVVAVTLYRSQYPRETRQA
jgi:hypothetical protein